jgi:hypothetical protein
METTYKTYEVDGHTINIIGGYEANYTAEVVDDRINIGADDTADDWAEAWVEVNGNQAYTICNDGRAPGNSEIRNKNAYKILNALYESGDLDEDEIRDTLHDALNNALDDYETDSANNGEEAVKDMIESEGYRCYYVPGNFANTGTLILITDSGYNLDDDEDWDDDAEERTAEEWASEYYRYHDAITEDYQSLVII